MISISQTAQQQLNSRESSHGTSQSKQPLTHLFRLAILHQEVLLQIIMVWLVLPWRESGWGLVLAGTQPQHRGSHIRFHTYFLNCPMSLSTPQFSYNGNGTLSSQGRVHFYSAQAQVWQAVTRLMLSELSVVTDCAAVVLCTVFVQSVHQKLAVLYTFFTCAQVDGGGDTIQSIAN